MFPEAQTKALELFYNFCLAYTDLKENGYTEEREKNYLALEHEILIRLERTFQEDKELEEEWADTMAVFQANANAIKNEQKYNFSETTSLFGGEEYGK